MCVGLDNPFCCNLSFINVKDVEDQLKVQMEKREWERRDKWWADKIVAWDMQRSKKIRRHTERERENEEGEGKIEEEWDDARGAGEAIESIGCKTEKRVEWCFVSYPCIVRALTNHKKGPSCHRSVHESHGEQYASNPCRLQLQTSTDTVSAPVDNRLNKLWFYKLEHY